jgi:isohexenylglutaconyl-CoA hydratase
MPDFSTLLTSLENGVFTVTLNRPDVKNAMSAEMVGELRRALDYAEREPAARVLVLRGAGATFCAGGDVKDMGQALAGGAGGRDAITEMSRAFGTLCHSFSSTPLPFVTVVEGAAMAGGLGLVCASDVTIAAPDATFGLPETSFGLVPAQIAPFLVERLGYSQAKRLAVTGGFLGAEKALAIGLVHEVANNVNAALERTIARILKCAPGAIAATKALVRQARFTPPAEVVEHAAKAFTTALRGEEGQEGTRAFVEKRPPSWTVR